jgi:SPX domain protein involved in polyphosphate accumulation
LKKRVEQLEERMTKGSNQLEIAENPAKITVAWLRKKCKKHEIRNYSRLNKAGLIQLLADHEIPMPY